MILHMANDETMILVWLHDEEYYWTLRLSNSIYKIYLRVFPVLYFTVTVDILSVRPLKYFGKCT